MVTTQGELSAMGNWSYFIINMDVFEPLQGNITHHCIRKINEPNERFPCCDVNGDYVVNMRDIGLCCNNFDRSY